MKGFTKISGSFPQTQTIIQNIIIRGIIFFIFIRYPRIINNTSKNIGMSPMCKM